MNTSTVSPPFRIGDRLRRLVFPPLLGMALAAPPAVLAQVQVPAFSASLAPEVIGAGSCSELTLTIDNGLQVQVTNLAFTLDLPAGVVLATPAAPITDCDGTLIALDGGTTVTFSGGRVPANSSCLVRVGITSSVNGDYVITTGDLTSSAGNSGTASVDLNVSEFGRPSFTKSFSPNPINFGGRSTLTYTIENRNEVEVFGLSFTDELPPGVTIADPSNLTSDCPRPVTLTADPGSNLIAYSAEVFAAQGFGLAPGASCTITVDVIGGTVGANESVSSDLTISNAQGGTESAGRACAVLEVLSPGTLQLTKTFLEDPVAPGGTASLAFTITNLDRSDSVTGITFTDDLDATLSGLTALELPANDVCGAGSSISGTSLITLRGGSLPPGGSCTFRVPVNIPENAPIGRYSNATSPVTGDASGRSVSGTPATDTLFVELVPSFTKQFTDDPVGAGESVTLEYTITNSSATDSISELTFTDSLAGIAPGTTPAGNPPPGVLQTNVCGAGSTFDLISLGTDNPGLSLTGGSLGPAESCTFSVVLQLPPGVDGGPHPSTTSPLTGTIADSTVTGPPASDDLVVVPPVRLVKEFTDDPVVPGDTVTLQFTLSNDGEGAEDATNIEFTDNLDDALSGLVAVGLPLSDLCGAGSQLGGTSTLAFSGGSLAAGETCVFSVTLQVPPDAPSGTVTNTTSSVMSDVLGVSTMGLPAADELTVAGLTLTKEFTDDPVLPGQTATLEFTLNNSGTLDATNIVFVDDLDAALSGLVAVGLPANDICGAGSKIEGTDTVVFSGGSVAAGTSCTFSITVQIPANAPNGTYRNVTGNVSANLGPSAVTLDLAATTLVVDNSLLMITKEFTDNPVPPGGSANLAFTLTNLSPTDPITGIAFTDDLAAALPGLTAIGLPLAEVCGAGSQIQGTSLLTFSGGSLPPGGTCTFNVTIQVPAATPPGTVATNTTSGVTGSIGAAAPLSVNGDPASDDLLIQSLRFRKSFDGPSFPGGTATLSFTIENLDATSGVSNLSFTDNLDNVIPGLVAVGLPQSNVCGAGSQLTGTSVLSLTGASLLPGGSCTFSLTVQIPPDATVGNFTNTTSNLRQSGSPLAAAATAELEIRAPTGLDLVVTKTESIDPVMAGSGTGNLEYLITVTNNGPLDATGVELEEALSFGLGIEVESYTPSAGSFAGTTWTLGDLPNGASETLTVVLTVGPSALGGVDLISNTASVTAVDQPQIAIGDESATEATTVLSPASMDISAGPLALDIQTALLKQTITVTNNNPLDVPAFRILVSGLPDGVVVHNAQGQSGGRSFLLYNQSLPTGATVDLVAEYLQQDASGGFVPAFEIELLDFVPVEPGAPGVEIDRIEALPNGDLLIEFTSTPGRRYTIQHSPDGVNWFAVVPDLVAGATRTQWIDNGPPKTPSHPTAEPTRLYRIVEHPDEP